MKEDTDGSRGCNLEGGESSNVHVPHTRHTAHHTPTLLTHIHTAHTARTVHIRSPMVEGSSMKLWREGGREGAEKYRQTGARGLDTDTQASVCAHTSTQAHGRTGPRGNLQYEFYT